MMGGDLANSSANGPDGVVEISLLLPAPRAAALIRLAKERQESVGQVIRRLIDRELSDPL